MPKSHSAKFIRMVAFSVFCVIFLASILFFSFVGKRGHGNENDTSIALPETSKYEGYPTVIIDAGHGGEDGGAIGVNGVYEKELNLMIALELEALLRSEGISTRLTRNEDILLYDRNSDYEGHKKTQDMAARLAIAEEYDDAIFISIHMNSFPTEKYSGLQVYYSDNSPLSRELASIVQTLTVQNLQPDNTRQIKSAGTSIYLLDRIKHPSILVECGFLTNHAECERLCSAEYRHRLCMVLYTSVINYFDTLANNPSDST